VSRSAAFGQERPLTWVDRFGIWLSARQVQRWIREVRGLRVLDVGCGYRASLAVHFAALGARVTALDLALAPDLAQVPGLVAVEGQLPNVLEGQPEAGWELIVCLSVLEHLWDPELALREMYRLLAPGGLLLVNVPSWRGRRWLEYSAFRLGLSPPEEMDDHKRYFDVKDLWPLLVGAGFLPSGVRCFRHKFGLNTFAACRKGAP